MTHTDSKILIADAGGTSTSWALVGRSGENRFTSGAINPAVLDRETINESLMQIKPHINGQNIAEVYFYGAGCSNDGLKELMRNYISGIVPTAASISVENDLLGAARALFGNDKGVACILGTGSNSGIYDGSTFVAKTPSLGYILGDEGSGASLGKRFLNAYFKGQFSETLTEEIKRRMDTTLDSVIEHTYRCPGANRYLASFCPTIKSVIDHKEINAMVTDEFRSFYVKNIARHENTGSLPLGFIGSVAWHFAGQLKEAFEGRPLFILQSPLDNLIKCHSELLRR